MGVETTSKEIHIKVSKNLLNNGHFARLFGSLLSNGLLFSSQNYFLVALNFVLLF